MSAQYGDFLARKRFIATPAGFEIDHVSPLLFDWQQVISRWAVRKGKCAIFADCGMGKTFMQLFWAWVVSRHTGGNVLILAPLAVAEQTQQEGEKFGINVTVCRHQSDMRSGVNVANYEMLHEFDLSVFFGIVLDESSILKAQDSKTRKQLTDGCAAVPYRLCCSATPSPNDYMELGNHAEFLGIMTRAEMLATFFVHDGGDTSKWRLKGHAVDDFWRWVCSWAVMIRKPSDIGYSDEGFWLPPINRQQITVESGVLDGMLFATEASTLSERRDARRESLTARVSEAARLANETHAGESMLLWCDLNSESVALAAAIPDAVEVTGADPLHVKRQAMNDFTAGRIRVLVSKPTICGYGMNWQHCRNMAFVGLSDSFEQVYQAERRCWRFGQKQTVNSYLITSEAEGAVLRNQERKLADFERMNAAMIRHMQTEMRRQLGVTMRDEIPYNPTQIMGIPEWLKEITC